MVVLHPVRVCYRLMFIAVVLPFSIWGCAKTTSRESVEGNPCSNGQLFYDGECRKLCGSNADCGATWCDLTLSAPVCLDDIGGKGCGAVDTDSDGMGDVCDPCPTLALPIQFEGHCRKPCSEQPDCNGTFCDLSLPVPVCLDDIGGKGCGSTDSDADGMGDICDATPHDNRCFADGTDTDSDGVCNDYDVCDLGDDHVDEDHDQVPDACDFCVASNTPDNPDVLSPGASPLDACTAPTLGFHRRPDSNCDGVDGEKTTAVFVRCKGAEESADDGSFEKPFATLNQVMDCIATDNSALDDCTRTTGIINNLRGAPLVVLVAAKDNNDTECTYTTALTAPQFSVKWFGGYAADFSERLANTRSKVQVSSGPAFIALSNTATGRVDGFAFKGGAATSSSSPTSYGGLVVDEAASYVINNCRFESSTGRVGTAGADGETAKPGCAGGVGNIGSVANYCNITFSLLPNTFLGGISITGNACRSPVGTVSGGGGSGLGFHLYSNMCVAGSSSGVGLGHGAGGQCPTTALFGTPGVYSAATGGPGGAPTSTPVLATTATVPTSIRYVSNLIAKNQSSAQQPQDNGADGNNGNPGFDGGGGAGVGLESSNPICIWSSGSAGGAGGEGGKAGKAGQDGGHSIGLAVIRSPALALTCSDVATGAAGAGGKGGNGSAGGAGGLGGASAGAVTYFGTLPETGGAGGNGSSGSGGSGGNGGDGGSAIGLWVFQASSATPNNALYDQLKIIDTNWTSNAIGAEGSGGVGGTGGSGGTSTVNGNNGLKGLREGWCFCLIDGSCQCSGRTVP